MKQDSHPNKPVHVTRATLPPMERYLDCVRDIFTTHNLTNQGKYATILEKELKAMLGEQYLTLCVNGTLALQLALRLFDLQGKKIITTPFTYVATVSALLWEGCEVIFADIDSETCCIDPVKVEKKLEEHPDAAGIMPVHVYGNSCNVAALDRLAKEHDVKIIYDGAHAFGSHLDGKSVLAYGDAATCSFHATKLFHTVEGGLVVAHNMAELRRLKLLHAFGHVGDEHICCGINGKISELHAAMGVALLPLLPEMIKKRAILTEAYDSALHIHESHILRKPRLERGLEWNHAYYPVIFPDKASLIAAIKALEAANIHPRRYFFPSLTELPYLKGQSCPVAEDIARRVLCLPLWADMDRNIATRTSKIILSSLN